LQASSTSSDADRNRALDDVFALIEQIPEQGALDSVRAFSANISQRIEELVLDYSRVRQFRINA